MDKKKANFILRRKILDVVYAWEIEIFGEELNEKNKWKLKSGRDAISLYLVNKHGWTIEHCQSLSDEVLRITLADEMKSWKRPRYFDELYSPYFSILNKSPED